MTTTTTRDQKIREAAQRFPERFRLRAYSGGMFRIDVRSSFVDDSGAVQLVVQKRQTADDMRRSGRLDAWLDFSRGTVEELQREVTRDAASKYESRGYQLMLTGDDLVAYLRLNLHADAHGVCPGCAVKIDGYESTRVGHARTCDSLARLVAAGGAL